MMTVTCAGCAAADNCPHVLPPEQINKKSVFIRTGDKSGIVKSRRLIYNEYIKRAKHDFDFVVRETTTAGGNFAILVNACLEDGR